MHKQSLVIGCGSHAHSVISIIELSSGNYEILGLIDTEDSYDQNEEKSGYKVILSLSELLSDPSKYSHFNFFIAVGNNREREKIYNKLKMHNFKMPNLISKKAYVDRTVKLGSANVIGHKAVLNSQSELGSNNLINTGAIIEHDCTVGDHNHIAPLAVVCGGVSISDLVLLGAGSIVLPKMSLSKGVQLGAGSVLNRNAQTQQSILVGIPAKAKQK